MNKYIFKGIQPSAKLLCSILLVTLLPQIVTAIQKKSNQKPNIIFLLADDLRYNSLGCMGNKIIKTPNIDLLAKEGTLFKNSFATTPICAISRASIFSGQYSKRHGIQDFQADFTEKARMNNYPEILRQNGFYTGFIGKYGVGTLGKSRGANMPVKDFDYWKGFEGHGVYFYKDKNNQSIHSTDMIGDQSIDFLKIRDKSKPFCLSVSFKAPHVEDGNSIHNGYLYSPFYENYYSTVTIPHPANGGDQYYNAFPESFRIGQNGLENEARVRWGLRFSTEEKFQESVKSYYRLVTGIDDAVKRIVTELKKQRIEKNTIIIFSSDNGYSLADHGLEGKWYAHDVSLRIPLIIYDGRKTKNKKIISHISLNVDLAPTILDYAGLPIPNSMQGKSLQPLAEGKKPEWRNEFYYDHLFETVGTKVYIPKSEGLVTLRYKYARYFTGNNPNEFFYEELFDAKTDPLEINNLATKSEMVALKNELIQKMKILSTTLK